MPCLRGLKRLLGLGKDDPDDDDEDPSALIARLRDTEAMVQKKIAHLERQVDENLAEAKRLSRTNKRAALQALGRKRRHERQLNQLDGALSTLEHQREALETATVNREIVGSMRSASRAMRAMNKDVSVDQIHRLIDSLQEQREASVEVSGAIAGPAAAAVEADEDELMAELRLLEKERQADEEQQLRLPSVVRDPLPAGPQAGRDSGRMDQERQQQPPQGKRAAQSDMEKLQAWLA